MCFIALSLAVATLAFAVSPPTLTSWDGDSCENLAHAYLATQRRPDGDTYAFCKEIAKAFKDNPGDKQNKENYFFECYCSNEPWAYAFTACLYNIGTWYNNKYKARTDHGLWLRCHTCNYAYSENSQNVQDSIVHCHSRW